MPSDTYELQCRPEKIDQIYEVKDQLGKGRFAIVRQCCHKESGVEGAAKYIKIRRTRSGRNGLTRENVAQEASILSSLDHEKIIKLYDIFDNGSEIILVLEYLAGGELFEQICAFDYVSELDASVYTKQVLLAIDYIHDINIVHLDIKPENIVLNSASNSHIKLVDFGLAQKIDDQTDLKQMQGTPEFVAPEIINFEPIGLYTDVWAIGVLAFIMISGCSPFLGEDQQETYTNITRAEYEFDEQTFGRICDDAKDFIARLLVKNPKKRMTAKESLQHPWITTEITPVRKRNSVFVPTESHKAFVARQRWQTTTDKMIDHLSNDENDVKGQSLIRSNAEEFQISPRISLCRSQALVTINDEPESLKKQGTDLYEACAIPGSPKTFPIEALQQSTITNSLDVSAAFHEHSEFEIHNTDNEISTENRNESEEIKNVAIKVHSKIKETDQYSKMEHKNLIQRSGNETVEIGSKCVEFSEGNVENILDNTSFVDTSSNNDSSYRKKPAKCFNLDYKRIVSSDALSLELFNDEDTTTVDESYSIGTQHQNNSYCNLDLKNETRGTSQKLEKRRQNIFNNMLHFSRRLCCLCRKKQIIE